MSGGPASVRVGIVGSGYIAAAHSAAYKHVAGTYPDVARSVVLAAAADTDLARAQALADGWGWQRVTTDWQEITRSPDIDLVDICVPNIFHVDVACDALAHGKHVICEKPLAHDAVAAKRMADAAASSGTVAQVCFYYRTWPAVAWVRQLLDEGRLGPVKHFRGWMLQDYAADPKHDLGWRARKDIAGAGATGDLGSHIIDLARYLCGDIASVCATTRTIIDRTPPVPGLDDLVSMLVEFDNGAAGAIEASWALRGHQCDLGFDLVCENGAVRFSWERFNEVQVMMGDVADPLNGYRSVLIGRGQPDVNRFVSVPGQGMGYRDAFTIGVSRVFEAIASGATVASPSFDDGYAVTRVIDAVMRSSASRGWADVHPA